jgi:hypothetical protein
MEKGFLARSAGLAGFSSPVLGSLLPAGLPGFQVWRDLVQNSEMIPVPSLLAFHHLSKL